MQRPINKEIRGYQENIFMGMDLRQLVCAGAAILVAVAVYFFCKDVLGQETASWLCIAAAVPFAGAGFFRYNNLNFEQFLFAVVESNIIRSAPRVWKAENQIYNNMQERLRTERKTKKRKRGKAHK